MSNAEKTRLLKEIDALRQEKSRLERAVAQKDAAMSALSRQIEELKAFDPDWRPDAFAPVRLEIVSRSRGTDFDGLPGDDGVIVYLRPLDADGDAVKVPGRVKIQVLDNSILNAPRLLGVYEFKDAQELREAWHGRFATQHYTFKCPLPPGTALPPNRYVTVTAEFVDFLTGTVLTAVKEIPVSFTEADQ
jgi:hypothetical protein